MSATAKRAEARIRFEQLCWLRDLYRLRGERDSTSCWSIEEALEAIGQAIASGCNAPGAATSSAGKV
jgi:hypothetical protein